MAKIEEIVIIVVKIRMIKIKDGKIMRILISPMIMMKITFVTLIMIIRFIMKTRQY